MQYFMNVLVVLREMYVINLMTLLLTDTVAKNNCVVSVSFDVSQSMLAAAGMV